MTIDPGTGTIFVTERGGRIKFVTPSGRIGTVSGAPPVAHGGQGGLGDIVLAPAPPQPRLDRRTVYLSWAEAGNDGTRGAAVARGELVCEEHDSCALTGLTTIWRQSPKTTGEGHYGHRIAFSPDGHHLFIASGERQKMTPAQDMAGNLGKVVRLLPDGTPAPGNPFAARDGVAAQVWTLGHRNILGLAFDPQGRLWDLEHGPRGGDEFNLVEPGKNYGWPLVSEGRHYDGRKIPPHSSRADLAAPAISLGSGDRAGQLHFLQVRTLSRVARPGADRRAWRPGDRPGRRSRAIRRAKWPATISATASAQSPRRRTARSMCWRTAMADACCGFYRAEANLVRHRSRRSLSARAVSTNIPPAIIPLADVDPALVEALLDRAFEPERRQRTAYKVREGTDWLPGLSFAALDEHDMLAGTIQCWPVALTDPAGKAHPMVMVGPVAVLPELQGSGYGKALMTASARRDRSARALAASDDRRSRVLWTVLGLFGGGDRWLGLAWPMGAAPPAGALRQSGGAAESGHAGALAGVVEDVVSRRGAEEAETRRCLE